MSWHSRVGAVATPALGTRTVSPSRIAGSPPFAMLRADLVPPCPPIRFCAVVHHGLAASRAVTHHDSGGLVRAALAARSGPVWFNLLQSFLRATIALPAPQPRLSSVSCMNVW
ncbi:hypothetical protein GUJ93_ZPchr0010g8695 [Zizania palustris]|uniref:Uncharacterized protein n=1 Tax=Zizania palustris TaxID=103762 RepID=A0A8J5W8I7_ZIZPA|nr:hypothetical protein GUJ93_ZPchr0010g8695 [Zizania palustris]